MKAFVFVVSACATFGLLDAAPRDEDIAAKIKEYVDAIFSTTPETLTVLKDQVIVIPSNDIENGEIIVREFSVRELKSFKTSLTYDKDKLRLDFTFSWEDVSIVFDSEANLQGLLTINQDSSLKIDVSGIKFTGYSVLSTDEKEVTDFGLLFSIGEAKFEISGVGSDLFSKLLSRYLTKYVTALVNDLSADIGDYFSRIFKDLINSALHII